MFLLPLQMLLITLNCNLWENFDPILVSSLTSCPQENPLMRGMLWTNEILGGVVLTVAASLYLIIFFCTLVQSNTTSTYTPILS